MSKGEDTRHAILGRALDLASEVGLEGLTIGTLAQRAGMSKSGLYAHFASKEALQCEVLDRAAERFVEVVIQPTIKQPRGRPRLEKLFDRWMHWEQLLSGGCPFIAAASELDDRPGPVRDNLVGHVGDLLGAISRAARIAIDEGHLHHQVDPDQFAFELWAIFLAYQQYRRLLRDRAARRRARQAFTDLLDRSST